MKRIWFIFLKYLSLVRAYKRIYLGFCPICNSDAPDVYDCGMCDGYQSASGDAWPPTKETKSEWWSRYKEVNNIQLEIRLAVLKSRAMRLAKEVK